MDPGAAELQPRSLESEVVALWRARRLPPTGGILGPPSGPVVRQFEGFWTQGDFPALVAQRAVVADVDARYLALAGRRASGTLRQVPGISEGPSSLVPALLGALGIWTGGDGRGPWDSEDRTPGVQTIVGRLAEKGILVTRDEAFRTCPTCGTLRSPERIVYEEQEGDTYLVRFPIRFRDMTVEALVWVDAPWKLLGTSAILLNPTLRYVVAGYRRREDRELVLTAASSLHRLRAWIPDSTIEVVEELEGRAFQGIPYVYPLRHEFPMGGELTPPAGTILCAADVGDSGTGIVPLVPGHGPTDSRIADRLGVTGWPLLNPRGKLDFTLMHKYAGLDLDTANEFVLRDLSEAGALLARLRVKRGVPYCAFCGTALLWAPARAWCLEPSHLPPDRRALFSRLLPGESLPGQAEVAPWPVSEGVTSDDARAITLLECPRCDRLAPPDGPKECPCGGQRTIVRRKLLPSFGASAASWARWDPFPEGDSAHLYVNQRRRVPALLHQLAALSGVEGSIADVSLTVAPTIGSEDVPALVATCGADAVRSALARTTVSESTGTRVPDRCRRETDRLRRWWSLAQEVISMCDASMIASFARPIGGFAEELEVEDRAIIARWERARVLALAHYDHGAVGLVHRQVTSFLDNDLFEYRELVRPRLALAGTPPTKRGALRTFAHLLRGIAEVLAPIAPFTSEAIHRSLSPGRTSLFEQPLAGLDRALLNEDLSNAWNRWRAVLRSVERLRRSLGVGPAIVLPRLVLVLPAEDVAERFRAEKETIARLARVHRLEVGSPREPWAGRQRFLRPVETEIQKVYPAQASQIIHLLQRMAPRKSATAPAQEELNVVIDGYPRRIFPSMVTLVEALPDRVVPVPWPLGEMYAELPAGAAGSRPTSPPLSSDAFWLVRRLERRLRAFPLEDNQPRRIAIVTAKDPLAGELSSLAEPLARYLGLGELRVVEQSEEPVPPTALTGRTKTGARWWVHVPGLPGRRPRTKRRLPAERLPRVAPAPRTEDGGGLDYADAQFVAREEAVRSLGQELDTIVGIPLLGPSKVAGAWELGFHSVDDLRHASFETIVALPGFGSPVAEVVVEKLGGKPPPRGTRGVRPPPPRPLLRTPVERRREEVPVPAVPIGPGAAPPARPPPAQEIVAETAPVVLPAAKPALETERAEPIAETPAEATREPLPELPEEAPSIPVPASAEATPPPATEVVAPETPTPAPSEALQPLPPAEPGTKETVPEVSPPPEERLEPELSEALPVPVEPERSAEVPGPVSAEEMAPAPSAEIGTAPPSATPEPAPSEEPPAIEIPSPLPEPEVEEQRPETVPPEPVPSLEVSPAAPSPPEPVPVAPPPEVAEALPPEPTTTSETGPATPSPPEPVPIAPASETPEAVPPEPTMPSEVSPIAPSPPEPMVPVTPQPEVAEALPAEPEPPSEESAVAPPLEPAPVAPAPEVPVGASPEPAIPSEAGTVAPSPPEVAPAREMPETPAPLVEPVTPTQPEAEALPVPEPVPQVVPPAVAPTAPVVEAPGPPTNLEVEPPPALEPAIPAPSEPEPPPPPIGIELTIGESLPTALSGFLDAAAAGHRGVCLVRESPERIRARVGSRPIEVYWMTNLSRGPSVRPADLDAIWTLLGRKLLEDHATAFFLEGLEYLVRLHGADAVLSGLVQFDRLARENDARIWVFLTPALMKPADIERFRSTFGNG